MIRAIRRDRILPGGRLAREHQGVGAVEDGVGDVGGLGAGGPRVGHHRLEHLGGHDHRLAVTPAHGDDLLLPHRNLVQRHLDPEISARHHHGVGLAHGLVEAAHHPRALELGDQRQIAAGLAHHAAHRLEVAGSADEAHRQEVGPFGDGEGDIGAVLVADRKRQVGVGEVDALAGRDRPAVEHPRPHLARAARRDLELDHSVVDQEPLAGAQVGEEARLFHRQVSLLAEDDFLALGEKPSLGDFPEAVARPHEVDDDGHETSLLLRHPADAADELAVARVAAVGEVEPHHVDPGVEELGEDVGGRGGRTQSGDDLGLSFRRLGFRGAIGAHLRRL